MSCTIHIDNPGIFGPGDIITGSVKCVFEEKLNVRAIKCRLRGKENTLWSEQRGRNQVRYSGERTFLTGEVLFVGEGRINAGSYEYPFSFSLPTTNICSSYQHRYGSIRYYVSAIVDKPFSFDYRDEITLHIAVPINFNDIRHQIQLVPITYQTDKQTGCCLCLSDFITLNMTLEKDCFVLGETIKVKVHVDNKSNVEIEQIEVKITSTIQFTTQRPSARHKLDKTLLSIANGEGVAARSEKILVFDLIVPQTTLIPSFQGCVLFKQWSTIGAEAVLPAFHTNLPLEVNINIGHIPYITTVSSIGDHFVPVPVAQSHDVYPPQNVGPPYPIRTPTRRPPALLLPSAPDDQANRPTAPVHLAEQEDDFNPRVPASPPPTYDEALTMNLSKSKRY